MPCIQAARWMYQAYDHADPGPERSKSNDIWGALHQPAETHLSQLASRHSTCPVQPLSPAASISSEDHFRKHWILNLTQSTARIRVVYQVSGSLQIYVREPIHVGLKDRLTFQAL